MSSRLQVYVIGLALVLLGVGFAGYKALVLDYPLLPGESRAVWTLESKITFQATGGPVDVSLALPQVQGHWSVLDEYFVSSGFGFAVTEHDGHRRARWTRRDLEGPQTLYYKLQLVRKPLGRLPSMPVPPVQRPVIDSDREAVVNRVIASLRQQSAGADSFTSLLLQALNRPAESQDIAFLLARKDTDRVDVTLEILAFADIPAHLIRGVFLEDGRRRQAASDLIEIYDGKRWVVFDPDTAREGVPDNFFIWQRGGVSLLDVVGGRDSTVRFAMVENTLPARIVLHMQQRSQSEALIDFSIYTLPVEQQSVFKIILLVPIGAMVLVFLRVFVGIKTSGTFMPVLIALAFIQTKLLTGVTIFLVIVSVGLWIRYYLSHLNLLLVSRVSAVVIVVVGLMGVISVVSYKLGIEQALTVTFFPMIVLAWTIERMSILWEEEGPRDVLIQGGGSLLAAVLAYLMMTWRYVEHLTFNFPELLLVVLGLILLMGQYNGYRLAELWRFRHFRRE